MRGTRSAGSGDLRAPRYRQEDAASLAVYMRQMSEYNTNAEMLTRAKRNLVRALNQDITGRQRQFLTMYYVEGLSMVEIARRLGLDKSTVSRTIRRGTDRLRRVLRYGAEAFLIADGEREGDA